MKTSQHSAIDAPMVMLGSLPEDGRQSERARAIARGTGRLLVSLGHASLPEVSLPNGRRADLFSIGIGSEIWIVEIKSSLVDFQTDRKWPEYQDYCDRFFFAVDGDFPQAYLPERVGIIAADRFGAEVVVEAPTVKLAAARRKVLLTLAARTSAARLQRLSDPDANLEALGIR